VAAIGGRGDHHGFRHVGMPAQCDLDLARLDPDAADLDLAVPAPEVLDVAVGSITSQIACAIEHSAGMFGYRVGDEPGGRHVRLTGVAAADAGSADVQLARHAHRHRLEIGVEEVDLDVGDRSTDRDRRAGRTALAVRISGRDGGLRGAVLVPQFGVRGVQEALSEVVGQRLAATRHPPQRDAVPEAGLGEPGLQHRRHDVDDLGDALLGDGPHEVGGVAVPVGFRDDETRADDQRQEDLRQRRVEGHRGVVQHPVAGIEPVIRLHPEQQVAQPTVGVEHPLRHAGRTRGVDHVSQSVRPCDGCDGVRLRRDGRQVHEESMTGESLD
jgi:hypothetical protein